MAVSWGYRSGDAIVVTGAGQGIGKAIALDLAKRGARLAVWDIDGENSAATAAACRKLGADALHARVDVSERDQIVAAARAAEAVFGAIFGLVNNAGIFPRASIMESTPELWRKVLGVNLLGNVFCSQVIGASMIAANRGAIVNIASGRALQGTVRGAHYAASKAGIVSFTKSLALEMAPHGVRANCIIPGITETAQPLEDMSVEELHALGRKTIPLGRAGQCDDLTGGVFFLLSEASAFMTGQSIAINGGAIMIP